MPMGTTMDDDTSVLTIDSSELDRIRSNVLQCQIATYRLLARNLPVSDTLLHSCSYKAQLAHLIQTRVEHSSSKTSPTAIVLADPLTINDENHRTTSTSFTSATSMYQWLVGSNESDEPNLSRIRQHPISLNPLFIQQEREKRYDNTRRRERAC
jgi:hypothetical protein